MLNLESNQKNLFETNVSVLCPQCQKPMTTGFSKEIIDLCKNNSNVYIPVMCGYCDKPFYFFPSTGELLLDDVQYQKK